MHRWVKISIGELWYPSGCRANVWALEPRTRHHHGDMGLILSMQQVTLRKATMGRSARRSVEQLLRLLFQEQHLLPILDKLRSFT